MGYTLQQHIFIATEYIRFGSYARTQEAFSDKYGTVAPNKSSIMWLHDKFQETGKVEDALRSGRPKVLTEEKLVDVQAAYAVSPRKSV
jgi:hypothetical protein